MAAAACTASRILHVAGYGAVTIRSLTPGEWREADDLAAERGLVSAELDRQLRIAGFGLLDPSPKHVEFERLTAVPGAFELVITAIAELTRETT